MQTDQSPGRIDYLTLLLLALIWGTSYIFIKWGLEVFSPTQIAALRLGISALVLAPFVITHFRRITRRQLPLLVLVGLTGTGLPAFLFPFAQTEISSSLTGMLSGLTPLCTFVLAWLFFADRKASGWWQLLGVLLGLSGALILAWAAPNAGGKTTQLAYAGFILLACFCYATSSNLVGAYFREMSPLTITVVSYFLVGIPALIWAGTQGAVLGTMTEAGSDGLKAMGYVAALAIMSTVLAGMIYYRMVQRTGPVFASTVSYIIPLIAIAWGLLDGEGLNWLQIPAIVLVLTGVFLSKRK